MKINYLKDRFTYKANMYRAIEARKKASWNILNKLNSSGSFTQIGDMLILNDGTAFNVDEIPKLNVGTLRVPTAKNNVMDFGNACYFRYTNTSGKSRAIFSMPDGALCRPVSEDINLTDYDRETKRYISFWNNLGTGRAMMSSPDHLPGVGYYNHEIRSYLDDAGISNGFFSVKIGSASADFFYSATDQYPIYSKETYDLRYYTMTSPDFSYHKSVFRYLEPGTEITISGEKYTLKDDFTLDIPYGTDIFDIQIPKYTPVSKVPAGIDLKV